MAFRLAGSGKTRDMTSGSIVRQIALFALPLMLGNIFQMLYNTVDSIVVGNFVGKEALAAVGSTTMIVNMLVFFFNGFSVGAGVVIAQHFGARDLERLHSAVETTVAVTFAMCVLFTAASIILGKVFYLVPLGGAQIAVLAAMALFSAAVIFGTRFLVEKIRKTAARNR